MVKLVIGITCGEIVNRDRPWSAYVYGQSYPYVQAVEDAGGIPILFPISASTEVVDRFFSLVDGVLFAGGNDINPSCYGQQLNGAQEISDARDRFELLLAEKVLGSHKPILGICRGMQLLNVACGGTLYQDLETDGFTTYDHNGSARRRDDAHIIHDIMPVPGSRLAGLVGTDPVPVNSRHHQAVRLLGDGVTVAATSDDGVIEAIELVGDMFRMGIQCHPEALYDSIEPRWAAVFEAFVNAAK